MNYCTYFDKNYLIQGLTFIHTLKIHNKDSFFYVLALDETTQLKLKELNLSYVEVINLNLLIKKFPILNKEKKKRNIAEFYFLLTPYLVYFILRYKKKDHIIYVDADMIFFSDCNFIIRLLKKNDILASYHDIDKRYDSVGKYNVGFLAFNKNDKVLKQLFIWMKQCLISTTIDKSFKNIICGDQKYIERWEANKQIKFSGIKIKNFNIGGWNIHKKKFSNKNVRLFCNDSLLRSVHVNFIKFDMKKRFFTSFMSKNSSKKIFNNEIKKIFINVCKIYKIKILNDYKKFFNFNYLIRRFLLKNLFDLNEKY